MGSREPRRPSRGNGLQRRAELGEVTKRNPTPTTATENYYFDPYASESAGSTELAREVGNAVAGAIAPVVAEVAAYPRQLPPRRERANLQPCSPHLGQRTNITH